MLVVVPVAVLDGRSDWTVVDWVAVRNDPLVAARAGREECS